MPPREGLNSRKPKSLGTESKDAASTRRIRSDSSPVNCCGDKERIALPDKQQFSSHSLRRGTRRGRWRCRNPATSKLARFMCPYTTRSVWTLTKLRMASLSRVWRRSSWERVSLWKCIRGNSSNMLGVGRWQRCVSAWTLEAMVGFL
jgi:hypothetical protein